MRQCTDSERFGMSLQWMSRIFPALKWIQLHKEVREVSTDRLDIDTERQIAAQSIRTNVLELPTTKRALKLPGNAWMCYQHPELLKNPHMLITGAVLECMEKNKRLPDILYIAPNTEIAYQLQLAKVLSVREPYSEYFHIALGSRHTTGIPVRTELPPELRMIYRNGIPRDTVIAVIDHKELRSAWEGI